MSGPDPSASLAQRALTGLAKFQLALALLIFLPAWSLSYWQGFVYWCVFGAATLALTLYFLRHDPALVERRMHAGPAAERETSQKIIQTLASLFVCAIFVVSALDYRFGWSPVPDRDALLGDVLALVGFAIMFLAFRANGFASSIIETGSGQTVISSGPYTLVRHPMYSGALLLFFATPLALGSRFGFAPAFLLTATIVWRLLAEEAYLARNLPGYREYQQRVAWHLVPYIW